MKKELDDTLCLKYPEIFKNRHAPMQETCMCWGFDCGDGWFNLIDSLCAHLMWSGKDAGIIPIAAQVKEKFGGLRFYVDGANEVQDALISFAEDLSYKICETCGTMKDVFQTEGWIRTTCPACNDARTRR